MKPDVFLEKGAGLWQNNKKGDFFHE